MRINIAILCLLLTPPVCTQAQVSVGIGLPGVNIGINLSAYPEMVPVPGYPVYYAPEAGSNLFFYDGVYWAYSQDNWYSSTWYNGPWDQISFEAVPLFLLRIPVGYYQQPPLYFREWREDGPPRWGERWGPDWARRHRDWDHWDRNEMPVLAPLPRYQRDYGGNRYPGDGQQHELRSRNYSYQPREDIARQIYQRPSHTASSPARERDIREGHDRGPDPRDVRSNPQRPPRMPPQERRGEDRERPAVRVAPIAAPVDRQAPPADMPRVSPRQVPKPQPLAVPERDVRVRPDPREQGAAERVPERDIRVRPDPREQRAVERVPERDIRVRPDPREQRAPVLRQAPPEQRRAPEAQAPDRSPRNTAPMRQDGPQSSGRPSGRPDTPGGERQNGRDRQRNQNDDRGNRGDR